MGLCNGYFHIELRFFFHNNISLQSLKIASGRGFFYVTLATLNR